MVLYMDLNLEVILMQALYYSILADIDVLLNS